MSEEMKRERLQKVLAACTRDWRWARLNEYQKLMRWACKRSRHERVPQTMDLTEERMKRERLDIMKSNAAKLKAKGAI